MMSGSLIRVVQKICVERMMLCCFLLLASVLSANSEERLVYRESYVLLFENVIADNPEKDVFLYINGTEQSSLIVIFSFGDGAIMAEWRMDNYTKIFIDANRNIKIANIDKNYEGKYYIQSSGRREVELTVSEKKLTEEEIKNWLDDHSGFIEKYLGNLTDEVGKEISKWLEDHPGFFKKLFDSSDLELYFNMIAIFVIVTVLLLVEPLSKRLAEVCTMLKSSRWRKYSLMKDQDQKQLHNHPDSEEKNYEMLKEDQVHKWLNDHPDFMENYLDQNGIRPTNQPTPGELAVTQNEVDYETEDNQSPFVSPYIKFISPKICGCSISVSDVKKLSLSPEWRYIGRTQDNTRKSWFLDLVFNRAHNLIVMDGKNNELKEVSLEVQLKSKLSFETRPDCLALTDGYRVNVKFPLETLLPEVDTRAKLFVVSTLPFKSQCAGIVVINDDRLIIIDRKSRSVIVISKDGEILQKIQTD